MTHLAEVAHVEVRPPNSTELLDKKLSVMPTFVVEVATLSGGCTQPGETRVKVSGLRVTIRPYNRTPFSLWGQVCVLRSMQSSRYIPLRFDAPGVVTIRVFGKEKRGKWQLIERQVEVRE